MRTEEDLLKRAKRFEPIALNMLQHRFYESIYRYVHYKVGDAQTSEDLTSEVFLKMLEAFKKGQGWRTTPDAWIFGIARHVVADYYRSRDRTREVVLTEHLPASMEQGPAHQVLQGEEQDELAQAISTLVDEYRDVILLRFVEELSIRDVAEIMNKTPGAIKGLQYRALRTLSRILQELSGQTMAGGRL